MSRSTVYCPHCRRPIRAGDPYVVCSGCKRSFIPGHPCARDPGAEMLPPERVQHVLRVSGRRRRRLTVPLLAPGRPTGRVLRTPNGERRARTTTMTASRRPLTFSRGSVGAGAPRSLWYVTGSLALLWLLSAGGIFPALGGISLVFLVAAVLVAIYAFTR